ncbi:Mitovirus RNA-dependent RNA polymerase, partial [Striga hermonthica]
SLSRDETVFRKYALLGDDIVIGDPKVASVYRKMMVELGVKISLLKSLVSSRGSMEFAKRFCSWSRDLSPLSVKMMRSANFSVAWMAVLNH